MDDPRIGSVVDERYEIHARLAAGGTGVVYRGERLGLAKPVAIKFLHRSSAMMPERLERFRREAAAMSRLAHPNLMSIIDFGESEGVPYLVMELHAGGSLQQALTRGALEPRRAVFIAYQILAGLGSAHDSGVLHRDLKPGNVLLVGAPGEDLVKILDFGVAKLLDAGDGPTELSAVAGRVLGTPEYMAPEQARSQPVDCRTDVYAVGVMLYEMVVGRRPFEGDNDLAVLRQQIEDAPVPPRALRPEISRELDDAIMRALAKDPNDRWASPQQLATALSELPEGSGVLRLRTGAVDRPAPTSRAREPGAPARARRGGRRVALLLALLLAVASGAVLATSFGYVDPPAMPWTRSPAAAPDDAPPDAAPPDAAHPDAAPPDAAAPAIRPEIRPYLAFLRQQHTAPVEYVMGLFDDRDIVVVCMRASAESTQYELVSQLVRDQRFIDRVGHVFTETGTISLRPYVADLVNAEVITDEELLHVERNAGDEPPDPNYGALLRSVQALNLELPPDQRVMVYPSTDQIVETVRWFEAPSKALVLTRDCLAPGGEGAGARVAGHLAAAYPGKVATVLLNQLIPAAPAEGDDRALLAPIANGIWDAAFELAGNRAVGFDFTASPFGRDPVREDATYQETFTGFAFREPMRNHRMAVAAPDPLADAPRALSYADANPAQWAAAQQQIARWLEPEPAP